MTKSTRVRAIYFSLLLLIFVTIISIPIIYAEYKQYKCVQAGEDLVWNDIEKDLELLKIRTSSTAITKYDDFVADVKLSRVVSVEIIESASDHLILFDMKDGPSGYTRLDLNERTKFVVGDLMAHGVKIAVRQPEQARLMAGREWVKRKCLIGM